MLILGFQKMTLLDFPGKVACTIFTGGCNLRCPFCHNALLVTEIDKSTAMDEGEILKFLQGRVGVLDGVCLTGGEPLLQPDVKEFIAKIKAMGFSVKLDTNGFYPDKLIDLVESRLVDYVAVDVKNSPEKYAETVGLDSIDLSEWNRTVAFLLQGKVDYEFRTTVVAEFHTVDSIEAAARKIRGAKRYFLQNFVDSGKLIGGDMHAVKREILEEMRLAAQKYVEKTEVRGV